MAARIELRRRKGPSLWTYVDTEDLPELIQHNWWAQVHPSVTYACRGFFYPDGRHSTQTMQTFLTGWWITDHIDGNGLNNQRKNLREATAAQNAAWARRKPGATSQHRGVRRTENGRWSASIRAENKNYRLGTFDTEVEAALAYNTAANELHGEFAKLNQIQGDQ